MKLLRRLTAVCLAVLVTMSLAVFPAGAEESGEGTRITVLFTHDMHSHLLPAANGEGGGFSGGYARLKAVIDQQRALYPDALLVDGGDFSMGSLFQTAYADSALELRVMGQMGYDATTFGNHEYDYRAEGLASMLNAAADSGDKVPAIVEANYLPPAEGEEGYDETAQAVWDAFANYGVADYILLERGGVWYAILGVMGVDSDECAPMSGMILHDHVKTTQRVVDAAVADCMERNGVEPVVICLSHAGTDGKGKGEDYELAKKVKGIDVIVSGHTHSTLAEPIMVNGTYIVSCGEYSKNLGVLDLNRRDDGVMELLSYELIPIDDTITGDAAIARWIESAKGEVEKSYLSKFNMKFDQVLVRNSYDFDTVDEVYASHHESDLGDLFSDAYKWAAEQATGEPVDMALTASGVIRESIPVGNVTVSDVFNAASLGIGADKVPGYPLVAVYLTGKDLKTAMEIDASVSDLMGAARLYCSGVGYEYNTSRMIFNKVTRSWLVRTQADGTKTTEKIDDSKLYRVVTGLYCGQMLGAVESSSFGLLSVTARDADGNAIDMDRLEDYIVHDKNGNEVKEWHAIATYLQSMGGEMDGYYSQPDGRKLVYASLNPVEMLKSPNKFTLIAGAVIVLLIVVIVLVVRKIVRRRRGGGGKGGSAKGYTPYHGKRK